MLRCPDAMLCPNTVITVRRPQRPQTRLISTSLVSPLQEQATQLEYKTVTMLAIARLCGRTARVSGARVSRPTRCYHDFAQSKFLKVSEEVRDAVATGKPVVALESTIYTHGMLYVI